MRTREPTFKVAIFYFHNAALKPTSMLGIFSAPLKLSSDLPFASRQYILTLFKYSIAFH